MKESAAAALSYIKGATDRLEGDVSPDWFRGHDLHLHVPAGAIPKDGPSAGITMATSIASLVTGRPVRSDTAMTGEITLTGQVLPIGGLKEKTLAAQRVGIERVIFPRRNEADVDELPDHLRKDLELIPVDHVDEVLADALETPRRTARRRSDGRRRNASRRPARPPSDKVAARQEG
jgi:ATP-dependent Lon protease